MHGGGVMFFWISKAFWALAAPSAVLFIAFILGALLTLTRYARTGRRLIAVGLVLLLAFGVSPFPNTVMRRLEERFPPYRHDGQPVAGIIVLGGGLETGITTARQQLSINSAGERVIAMADLARRYPLAKVIYTGGGAPVSEAETARRFATTLGIDPSRIMVEGASRNTIENGRFTRAMVLPQPGERWLLVTSASHMPRAMGVFRKQGFDPIAYPVDYHTTGTSSDYGPFRTVVQGLGYTDIALKEVVGLAAYWVMGETDALFPSP